MGKKTRSTPTSPVAAPQEEAASLASLKDEANIAFAKREYDHALATWDRALKLAPSGSTDAALLHSNKAACHMINKRFKEAVNECSTALELQPSFFKALVRRGKAYEQMGQLKNALTDLQRANKLDAATQESKEAEQRLRDAVAGKKPSGLGNGLGPRRTGGAAGSGKAPAPSRQIVFPAKLSFEDDVRALQLVPGVTYLELIEHVRQLFPAASPFVLKYLDKEGDLVTIGSRNDVQRAMQEAVETASRSSGNRGPVTQASLAPIRLQVVRVSSEDQVPKVPEDELAYVQQMLAQLQKAQAARGGAAEPEAAEPEAGPVQVDEWILSFVDLLKEHCGIDPDRPLEASEVGNDKLQAAFQEMMEGDPKADTLLDAALEKFEDQVCFGMYNQATVHQYRAEFAMYRAARAGEPASSVAEEVERHLARAEAKHAEALEYKPTFLDGYLGQSSVAQSRAKLAADYLLEPVRPREDLKDAAERAAAEEAANRAAQAKAFQRVSAESAQAAEAFMDASYALIGAAIDHMSEEERGKEVKPMRPTAEQTPGDPESEMPVKASLLINLGNAHYEHSILRAAGGLDWRPLVEKAAAKFREAGAHQVDIRNALKGHPLSEELADLIGPEPEEPEVSQDAPTEESTTAPKGLPALPSKSKKKEAEAAA
ncbi:hypothetical protein ACKKBF_B38460 [Auxenochlorella protothecoides x Auxenochlorella symbiontica]